MSLLICPSILFGCDDKDEGGPIENLHIYTLNDGVSSLNPLLTWDDDGSKSYSVTINNKSISDTKEEAQVSSPFSLGGYLEPSSEYTVTIKDKRSNQCDSVTFTTISEGSGLQPPPSPRRPTSRLPRVKSISPASSCSHSTLPPATIWYMSSPGWPRGRFPLWNTTPKRSTTLS